MNLKNYQLRLFSFILLLGNYLYTQESSKVIFEDNFSEEISESREFQRGKWVVKDSVLTSVWSKEATIKTPTGGTKSSHKVFWNAEFDDGCIEMEVYTKDIKSILMGLDGQGHVAYLIFNEDSYKTIVFPTDKVKGWVKKTNKYETSDIPSIEVFKQEQWTNVKITTKGTNFQLQVGDYITKVQDIGFGRHKKTFGFNFTEGEIKIRNVKVTAL